MRSAHRVADIRVAEHALMASLADGALMQRAAFGLASACAGLLPNVYGSRLAVLAGSGDNGGDALHAGAILAGRGAAVTAIAAGSRVHKGGLKALLQAGGRVVAAAGAADAGAVSPAARQAVGSAELVIDGLLGIGGQGGLREPAASLASLAERSAAIVVAVDLPSGIDADTGEVAGAAVRADVTITFGTWKPGLLVDPGASHAGVTELIDIGLAPYLGGPAVMAPQAADIAGWLPRPSAESDKYRRGVLGVLAGSGEFTGAAVLSVGGAVRGGAGMVRLVSAGRAAAVVRQYWPEAVITVVDAGQQAERSASQVIEGAGRVQAWVAGPGMGTDDAAGDLLEAVLSTDVPVLVDADGITMLAARRDLLKRGAPTLITPHAGELARLLGAQREDIEARRLEFARLAAAELGVIVLLKGSTTVVAVPPDGEPVLANPTGTSWLATAGSGDVLSGLAGSLLAQGLQPQRAAAAAAYLHGVAARLAAEGAPIGAADLLRSLSPALRTVAGPD
jgi:hydroxyethylthiazole kinase-like uncharacterized protein yjeF